MAEADDFSAGKHDQIETVQGGMSADPVVRTALLVRRMRAMGSELRDVPSAKRDLIVKMWSHGAAPAEIAHATGLPTARVDRILGLRAAEPAPYIRRGASDGVEG